MLQESLSILPCSDFVKRPRVRAGHQADQVQGGVARATALGDHSQLAGLGASSDNLVPKLADRWHRCQLDDMWHPE